MVSVEEKMHTRTFLSDPRGQTNGPIKTAMGTHFRFPLARETLEKIFSTVLPNLLSDMSL